MGVYDDLMGERFNKVALGSAKLRHVAEAWLVLALLVPVYYPLLGVERLLDADGAFDALIAAYTTVVLAVVFVPIEATAFALGWLVGGA